MTDNTRLADLTGITEQSDELSSFWPVNLALVVLGGAIMGLSFYFLDAADPRVMYNPWTYAVATPVILLTLSAVLSTFVSRLVEKSMQFAFLLSILIHLILLVYAVNVVIFSRMWPEVLQSLAREQHQLEREALQAKQYLKISSSAVQGRKPDYLRHVPTVHQPTEIKQADTPALELSRSDTADLVSPSPKRKQQPSPHLLERKLAQDSVPTTAAQLASLARSELELKLAPAQAINMPQASDISQSQPAPLQPSQDTMRRSRPSDLPSRQLPEPTPQLEPSPQPATPRLNRTQPPLRQSPSPQSATQLSRSSTDNEASRLGSEVVIPQMASSAASGAAAAPLDAMANLTRRSAAAPLNHLPPLDTPSPAPSPSAVRTPQRQAERLSPAADNLATGNEASPIPRDTAGGQLGSAAPLSMPVQGPQALAADQVAPSRISAPQLADRRLANSRRSASSAGGQGLPQAPTWSGAASQGAAGSGRAPGMTRSPAAGEALRQDIAGLPGAARDIQRATLGPPGSLSAAVPAVSDVPAASGADLAETGGVAAASGDAASRDSNATSLARRSQGATAELANASPLVGVPTGQTAAPKLLARAEATGQAATAAQSTQSSAGEVARSSSQLAAPESHSIELPDTGAITLASGPPMSLDDPAADSPTRSSSERSATSLLDIDAALGPAGVDPSRLQTGPLLARRNDRESTTHQPQIEPQRFARQEMGGPLAAGQSIAIPKPAFQQRIDRLRDNRPQDESSLAPQTELAIELGLAFLERSQREDGSWKLQDYDTQLLMRSDTAATSLSLLAFQGAGYTHQQFKYSDTVRRGLTFLISHQRPNGDLYIPQNPASDQNAWLYSHGIAALALCEAYGMTQDPELRPAAQSAIDFIVLAQDPKRGGWRYRPGAGSDTSVTGWFMMAAKSARLAGLEVPESAFQGMEAYLTASQVSSQEPHLYRYNPYAADTPQQRHGLKPTAVMTSVGLLMRLYTGWDREHANLQAGADYLLERLPELGTPANSQRDTYYWYYATQVMFHMRGQYWKQWHDRLYPLLINHQEKSGEYAGSWHPQSPTPDLWARYGGRLYVTTMNLLSLEISYRHLPLYDETLE